MFTVDVKQQCNIVISYLAKHVKAKHDTAKVVVENAKRIPSETRKQGRFVLTNDHEDWDSDPAVDVEEPEEEIAKESEVKCNIIEGRMIRKSTNPLPLCAPKRAKTVTKSFTEHQARTEMSDKPETSVIKKVSLITVLSHRLSLIRQLPPKLQK